MMNNKIKILVAAPLTVAVLTVVILLLTPAVSGANECRSVNPSWYECQSDSDCEIIYNPCGWPTEASSAKHAEEAKRCNRLQGVAIDCATYDPTIMGVFTSKCQSGVCVAIKSD